MAREVKTSSPTWTRTCPVCEWVSFDSRTLLLALFDFCYYLCFSLELPCCGDISIWLRGPSHELLHSRGCFNQIWEGWECEILEKDSGFIIHAIQAYINQHFLLDWITALEYFLMDPFNIKIQVFAWILSGPAQLSQGVFRLCKENLGVEGGDHMRPILDLSWLEAKILGVSSIC